MRGFALFEPRLSPSTTAEDFFASENRDNHSKVLQVILWPLPEVSVFPPYSFVSTPRRYFAFRMGQLVSSGRWFWISYR